MKNPVQMIAYADTSSRNMAVVKTLTYLMFAMTTDSVGRRVSLRGRRGRDLRLDADADGGIRRFGCDAGHLQHLNLLPFAIGAVADAFGHIVFGFWLATGLAALLYIGLSLNWAFNPTRATLEQLDVTEYRHNATA